MTAYGVAPMAAVADVMVMSRLVSLLAMVHVMTWSPLVHCV